LLEVNDGGVEGGWGDEIRVGEGGEVRVVAQWEIEMIVLQF